uniref:Uncharacterized protein n=1 Tax=Acrobeloides nanus TaxID=290746 RepID=A0A914DC42_9BILA
MPPKRKNEYKPEYSKKFQGIRKGKDTFHAHCIPCNDEISLTSIGAFHTSYTFVYPYTFEHSYSSKENEIFYVSETLWAGGFPWAIICQYDRAERDAPPMFVACIRSMKFAILPVGFVKSLRNSTLVHRFAAHVCRTSNSSSRIRSLLAAHARMKIPNGKLMIEVFIQVDWRNVKGISALADFQSLKISSDSEKLEENDQLTQIIRDLENKLLKRDHFHAPPGNIIKMAESARGQMRILAKERPELSAGAVINEAKDNYPDAVVDGLPSSHRCFEAKINLFT